VGAPATPQPRAPHDRRDYAEGLLEAGGDLPVPAALAPYQFTASARQPPPDGLPVDDLGLRRRAGGDVSPEELEATAVQSEFGERSEA
jgi:hypothetical protein